MEDYQLEETKEFWDPIIRNENGSINEDQLYKELHDFSNILKQIPYVYEHVTGGMISKPNTHWEAVTNLADIHYRDIYKDSVKALLDQMLKDGVILTEHDSKTINHWIEIFI